MHPVARPLAERFGSHDRRTLAARISRSLRNMGSHTKPNQIYRLIDEGRCSRHLAGQLAATLDSDMAARFRNALMVQDARRPDIGSVLELASHTTDEWRPHLWILHERARPKGLFIVALTGLEQWKRVPLPESIERQSWREQRRLIRQAARTHFRNEGHRDGLFGRATDYLYRPVPDRSYRLTTGGSLDSLNLGPLREPQTRYLVRMK